VVRQAEKVCVSFVVASPCRPGGARAQAATKKQAGSGGPFQRKLSELYTKATYIPEELGEHRCHLRERSRGACSGVPRRAFDWSSAPCKYIMCISERAMEVRANSRLLGALLVLSSGAAGRSRGDRHGAQRASGRRGTECWNGWRAQVALDVFGGDLVWDVFEDRALRSEVHAHARRHGPADARGALA
jgi:hypothetical protein